MQIPHPMPEFERLVRAHHAAVYRTAFAILRRNDQALDVAQQVFLRVLEGRERLERAQDEAKVLRWVAARQALMHQRSESRRREKEQAMSTDDVGPDELPEHAELREILPRLVSALPEPVRNAVVLRFEEQRTYAEIGALVGTSETAAHERVGRGLEKLRAELGRLGFGALVPALERTLECPAPVVVPAGLQAQLIAAGGAAKPVAAGAAASAGTWAWLAGAAALVLAGVAAWSQPWNSGAARPLTPVGLAVVEVPPPASVPAEDLAREALPRSEPEAGVRVLGGLREAFEAAAASAPPTWIEGRVVDAEGFAIPGADVRAVPADAKGGWHALGRGVESDAAGRFRWELLAGEDTTILYDVFVRRPDYQQHVRSDVRVQLGRGTSLGDLALARESTDADGEFELVLRVEDAQGRPIAGTIARVFRDVRGPTDRAHSIMEATGPTDAGGTVVLRGGKLGRKRLDLDARPLGWRRQELELAIDAPGSRRHTVVLEPGLTIAGVLRAPDGGPPPRIYVFHAHAGEPLRTIEAQVDDRGGFVIRGLEPVPHTLRCTAEGMSAFQLSGIAAGREDLDLRLKPFDDPRDVGLHRGEVHGVIVERGTGRELPIDPEGMQIRWVESESEEHLRRIELPTQHEAMSYQTIADSTPPPPRADFHFHDLDAGLYVVRAAVPGVGVGFSALIRLQDDQIASGIRVEVGPGILCGRVVDAAGMPVEKAYVLATGSGPGADAAIEALELAVRAGLARAIAKAGGIPCEGDGTFLLENLPAGLHYRIAAAARGHAGTVSAPMLPKEDRDAPLELRLRPPATKE